MKGIALGAQCILVGKVATDIRHVDTSDEFIHSISALLGKQEGGLVVEAPAAHLTTNELVSTANVSSSFLALTHSCHTGNHACGTCRGCFKHQAVLNTLLKNLP